MPTTLDGVKVFLDARILYSPGKASNAGGVATSGLEMSQNSMRLPWSKEEVDQRLHQIMKNIHQTCLQTAEKYGTPGQLRERREYRRLPQGCRCNDGSGPCLTLLLDR